ncbi:MAG: transcriptional regulator [Gammaproteobacteria bacterium]|nr:MAG: transcriptional regulator [Gammaproteobacteria bacterium]
MAEDYVLDKTLLSSDEQKLIMSSLLGINSMVDVIDQRLLLKLRAIFAYADESYLCVDFSRWGNNTDKTKYPLIKEAILSKYSLKLTYINRYNSTQTRVVKPIKLCFKSRGWYLLAEDDKDKKQKYFKLTRMLQLELGEKLNHIPQLAIDAATAPDYPEITITFDKSVLYRVYDEFDGSLISDNGDCVVVSVNMPVDDWLYGYLLSFCGKVIDVKPGYIMDNVKRLIHTMQYQYQSD